MTCRHRKDIRPRGLHVIETPTGAVAKRRALMRPDFEMRGAVSMGGCHRPRCAVFRVTPGALPPACDPDPEAPVSDPMLRVRIRRAVDEAPCPALPALVRRGIAPSALVISAPGEMPSDDTAARTGTKAPA